MNKNQKTVINHQLKQEEKVLKELKMAYAKAEQDIDKKIKLLEADELTQSKIYQVEYQKALKGQIGAILDNMNANNYTTIHEYLKNCYTDAIIGNAYDLAAQGVPLIIPIDQEAAVNAIQLESKVSGSLYTAMGVDVKELKKNIASEVTRGISKSATYKDIARNISNQMNTGLYNATRIARTEGHRVIQKGTMDAMNVAKSKGADVVKQWDSTLDGDTRPSHRRVDGEIRELDEPFSNGLMYPGDPNGKPGEVIQCRCVLLQRAKWALDEDELDELKKRAEFFGLDKNAAFEEYKKKYLKALQDTSVFENDKPIVKTPEEFDRYIKENGLKPMYRGYSAETDKQLAEYFETYAKGTVPVSGEGTSALGSGVYFTATKNEANDYMHRRQHERGHKKGQIITATLKPNAKIGDHDELKRQQLEEVSGILDKVFKARNDGNTTAYDKYLKEYYKINQMKFDEYVRYKGYDAVYEKVTKYTVVMNQNAMVIRGEAADIVNTAAQKSKKTVAKYKRLFTDIEKADDYYRKWADKTTYAIGDTDLQDALYCYTLGSDHMNRPLSGYDNTWSRSDFKGIGKVNWNNESKQGKRNIDFLTKLIDDTEPLDTGVVLVRGSDEMGLAGLLESAGFSYDEIIEACWDGSIKNFKGSIVKNNAFTSCSVSKGAGLDGVVSYEIKCPAGTKMVYAEPQSYHGKTVRRNGNGMYYKPGMKKSGVGSEVEMIIQRGTYYRIDDIEIDDYAVINVKMTVVDQNYDD